MTARLTPEQLGIAVRANACYRHITPDWADLMDALGGTIDDSYMLGRSEEVADAVADFQAAHPPLHVDGVCGFKTSASLRRETWTVPACVDYFVASDKRVGVEGVRVVDYREPGGLSFYATPKALYGTRSTAPNLSVLHWSVTATAHQAFNALVGRGLSVQLLLDDDGTFYQLLDLATATAWHAGVVNPRSFGVEIAGGLPPRAGDPGVPLDVRGDQTRFASFTTAQVDAIVKAWPALHRALDIPLLLPQAPAGGPWTRPDGVARDKDARVASGGFVGACGHLHVTTRKADPGSQLWPALRASGFGVA